jgi:nitroimidazol reductase NimA-like FMN-containing flavoprotein (pyridoxamine 5'-phosphate oxidase superfamily)
MIETKAELDPRFSDPDAVATPWSETLRVLETAQMFWLSTVRAGGRPHVTPLVAVWLDGAIHFTTGGGEQKAVNLRANPHVVLTTGGREWSEGLDVVVEGDAVRVVDAALLARLAAAWATKWDGRWRPAADGGGFDVRAGSALVFAVKPTKILAFAKGSLAQTRYRF